MNGASSATSASVMPSTAVASDGIGTPGVHALAAELLPAVWMQFEDGDLNDPVTLR